MDLSSAAGTGSREKICMRIDERDCYIYDGGGADVFLIQPIDRRASGLPDRELALIWELVPGISFGLAAFSVENWNDELSPWAAEPAAGGDGFGGGAAGTLEFIIGSLLPKLNGAYGRQRPLKYYLGGYSLAGLFALWASYQTDVFGGAAGVSASVWFPGWDVYTASRSIRTPKVYLSLGDREERTKNKTMARVGDSMRRQYGLLCGDPAVGSCVLEWNPGNHFTDTEMRMARGFAWLLDSGAHDGNGGGAVRKIAKQEESV